MKKILLSGEAMGMLMAKEEGSLQQVREYSLAVAGAEYNVALGLTRLGFSVAYVTKLGNDVWGSFIQNDMVLNHIDTQFVKTLPWGKTGYMFKELTFTGDPSVYYYRANSAASGISPEDFEEISLEQFDAIHLTGVLPALSKSAQEATLYLAKEAKRRGIFLSFDPNLRPSLWENEGEMIHFVQEISQLCDLFLPGIAEAKQLTGKETVEEILKEYEKIPLLALKVGEQGAYIQTPNTCSLIPGFSVDQVVDTVGAGDGFAVGVLSGLLEGLSFEKAVERGNAIGARQVTFRSDNGGLPTREELSAFCKRGAGVSCQQEKNVII